MPHFQSKKTGAIWEGKKPSKYRPHSGNKEAVKAAKRIAQAEAKANKNATAL